MKKIDFMKFTNLMKQHYSLVSIKKIRTNKTRPSFKKQIEFKRLYGIPHEFWVDVRSNLTNIPKRGRKPKKECE
ncbi:hypothetical protein CD56_03110 [Campylobacter lari]|uniref:Uncharacterized protein n=2 Tax=Campylobacter TaxID=194 RepID=A0A6M8MRX9_9BACT|nr:hypothetical protein [Campylobacter lari]OCX42300.1 hypothetical protein A7X81_03670 [Campylobacter ornithocola]AKJ53373.1 hypothetical protein CD56_03110 [Campylobacter lari]EAH6262656.1 hypothetical protein [Campylobacter lari]EAI3912722.1 hypothetical protein [Campylobacter lari]EAI4303603.1 hypothetical protein [Campylobacter lari]